jgi:DNA-binding beta-propeller fold protein YncE
MTVAAVVALSAAGNSRAGASTSSHRAAPTGIAALPLAARVPVSNALGKSAGGYAVRTRHAALVLTNPAQRLRATFDRSGAHFRAGTARLGLGLVGVGAGDAARSLSAVTPSAHGNRVSYAGRGVKESFVNGPLGVEQTFTVSHAQAPGRVLSLALAVSGDARARISPDRKAATFAVGQTTGFRYSGLAVKDARGRSLHAWLATHGRHLLIDVDVRHARYPITIDPLIQQGSELTGLQEVGKGLFGATVALSSDGSTALVGAPNDAGGNGAAFVFTRSGGTWSEQAELYASCTFNCANEGTGESGHANFGSGLALSGDGNTAAIGAPADTSAKGAVWVFTRSGGAWTEQTELVADCTSSCDNEGTGETTIGGLGSSLALDSQGLTLVAGAPYDNGFDGAAWVFTRSGTAWSQQSVLVADCTGSCSGQGTGETASGFGEFGLTVALSGAGTSALVGAPDDLGGDGSAWTYTSDGTAWTFGSELVGDCTSSCQHEGIGEVGAGNFASSLSLSGDANTALIGAPSDDSGQGAAWVFTKISPSDWLSPTKLTGNCTSTCAYEGTGESGTGYFGSSASLSSDGNRAIIGAYQDSGAAGSAWMFTRSVSAWTQDGAPLVGDCDSDASDCTYQGSGETGTGEFGVSAAVSADASTIIVGGQADASARGGAWVFAPVAPEAPPMTQAPQFPEVDLGSSVKDTATVAGDAAHGNSPSGGVTFYACGPTSVPSGCDSHGKLVGSGGLLGGANSTASATSPAFTPATTGTYCFDASYAGDGQNYLASADGRRDGCVRVSQPATAHPTFAYTSALGGTGSSPGKMSGPQGVALGESQVLYVADTGNNRIEQFGVADGGGAYDSQIAGPGYLDGQVDAPLGMTYDASHQNLYVVDSDPLTDDPRVEVFSSSGVFKQSIGSGGSIACTTFDRPFGVATDVTTGALYVTDEQAPSPPVHEFNGSSCRTVGDGQFGSPSGVAVDPQSGYVYIADEQNDRILAFGPNGDFRFQFGSSGSGDGQFSGPTGVAVDHATGNVYVVDAGNDRIEVFSPQGAYLSQFGSAGSGPGQLENPAAVAVDTAAGYAYVADTGNDRVDIFQYIQPAPPPAPPGGSCVSGQTDGTKFGLVHIQGCLTQASNGSFTTTTPIYLNGIPLSPTPGHPFVIDPPGVGSGGAGGSIGVATDAPMTIDLGKEAIFNGTVTLQLPAGGAGDEGTVVSLSANPINLFGFKVGGSFTIALGEGSDGSYYSSFTVSVNLPNVLQSATGGGVMGSGSVRVDDDGVVQYNGVLISASDLKIGPLTVNNVCFSLIPAGSGDVDECQAPALSNSFTGDSAYLSCNTSPGTGDQWAATASITLPTPTSATFAAFGSGVGTTFTSFGGFGQNLDLPIAEGVSLDTLGVGICFPTSTQPLTFRGDLGAGLVPIGDHNLVTIVGTVLFTNGNPWTLTLGGAVNVYDIGQVATGNFNVDGNGNFGFGLTLNFDVLKIVTLTGNVSGAFYPNENKFNVQGGITACLDGFGSSACASAEALVSSIGTAACFTATGPLGSASAGYGYTWSTKQFQTMGNTCDIGAWLVIHPASHTPAGGPQVLTVAPGSNGLAFRAFAANGPPGLTITGQGTTMTVPTDDGITRGPGFVAVKNLKDGSTSVLLAGPKPGNYTVTALDPSNPITSIQTASVVAPFSSTGTVKSASGGRRTLSMRYVLPTGAKLGLVERSATGGKAAAQHSITPVVHGKSCGPGTKQPEGGQVLCYKVTFTPAHGPGGKRQIVAVVTRAGLVSAMQPVATYQVANPAIPSRPSALTIRRTGTTVVVLWSASRNATTYGFSAQSPGRTTISRFLSAACHGITLTGIPTNESVKVAIAGIRYDGARGQAFAATLAAGKKTAGTAGAHLSGMRCH